ncbi:polysialyltransferase family glycosyltransferase [Oceanisphaera pacifica]|uniref:Uncharacterized protein n=1 Tax=Oceanisphaera pacifica TaxID=2818389 RepID=A0ABS3NHD5_9GAMM|nr:polysialyltransferase family glycosyltransferase [Oceanisphaera pacifica]MBO1519722.1 hypothetical protein [Oceanisphaera pacifica]
MNNLYIVESPLQALCALEVSLENDSESNSVVVRTSGGVRPRNDKQLLSIINKREWQKKIVIEHPISKNPLSHHCRNRAFLSSIESIFGSKVTSLYIGEFRSSFMHMVRVALNASNVYLLDDGAASIKAINNYIKLGYNYPYDNFYPKNLIKKIIFYVIYNKYIDEHFFNKRLRVVTAFSNDEHVFQRKISFDNIKKLLMKDKFINSQSVYYYGSKYSEAGIISLEYEMYFLGRIRDFYDKRGKKVTYFAHRDESEQKLNYISNTLMFNVIVPDVTAEVYLLESDSLPSEVSGAYTSVLNNIKVILPEVPLRSFKLNSDDVGLQWRDDIENVYQYFKKLNIHVEV